MPPWVCPDSCSATPAGSGLPRFPWLMVEQDDGGVLRRAFQCGGDFPG